MRALAALLVVALGAAPAVAHQSSSDYVLSGSGWTYDPWLAAPLYLAGILFLLGTRKMWRRAGAGHGVRMRQAACFWSGWLVLALALVSPLHWLSEHLFSAHMVEHELLMVVAAPLIAYSRPSGAMLWSLPRNWRQWLGGFAATGPVSAIWAFLSHPVVATVLQGLALWLWHMPRAFELALNNDTVHRLQHLSFFLTALLFWWVMFYGRGRERGERVRDGINVGCLFLTMLHCGLLGAVLTLSTHVWVPAQVTLAADWGLTPLEDQQLAGLLMWIPMGIAYTGAGLFFAWRWLDSNMPPQTLRAPG